MDDIFICSCETNNGYVLKNFTSINGSKSTALLIFGATEIFTENCTDDSQICCRGRLNGNNINLKWNTNIPAQCRILSLMIEKSKISETFLKIKMKETAKIQVYQAAKAENKSEYTIFLSKGTAGNSYGREGIQSIPAISCNYTPTMLKEPGMGRMDFQIPITQFKTMISSFTKEKKSMITLKFYSTYSPEFGKLGCGLSISNCIGPEEKSTIFEKFGEINEDEPLPDIGKLTIDVGVSSPSPNNTSNVATNSNTNTTALQVQVFPGQLGQLPLSTNSSSSSSSGSGSLNSLSMSKVNEYTINANKIPLLHKFSSIHKEGNIIISYEPGCHLCISGDIGSFATLKLYLHNHFIGTSFGLLKNDPVAPRP